MDQRVRSRYDIIPTPIKYDAFPVSCANRSWTGSTLLGDAYLNGEKESMSDFVVPRFHARSKAGEKFFNPLFHEKVTVTSDGSDISWETLANVCVSPNTKGLVRTRTGGVVSLLTPRSPPDHRGNQLPLLQDALSQSEIDRVCRAVSTEVLSKVGTGDAEMWESVAEVRKTIAMLQAPVQRLLDLTGRIDKSISRSATGRQLIKEVSDGYLMYRYGITPLMKDIRNILSSLDKKGGTSDITSRAKEQLSAARTFVGSTTHSMGATGTWQCQVNDVLTVRGMSLNRGYVSFWNSLGFDMKGLLLLPLQLTSYSFVADWFLNLSSYVKATMPALGWTPLGAALVTTRVRAVSYTLTTANSSAPAYFLSQIPTGSVAIVSQQRHRGPLTAPSLEINSDFKFDEMTRVADAIGLVAARFVKVSNLVGYRSNNSAFHDRKAFTAWAGQPDVAGYSGPARGYRSANMPDARWSGKL